MPSSTHLTIQQLYDDTREALQLGWFAGFPGGERRISGDAISAADQVGHLNLVHPGRLQVFGHQEIQYYNRLSDTSRKFQTEELVNGHPPPSSSPRASKPRPTSSGSATRRTSRCSRPRSPPPR